MTYSDEVRKLLDSAGAVDGSMVELKTAGHTYEGRLMPHLESSASDIVVLKMESGYDVGLKVRSGASVKVLDGPLEIPKRKVEVKDKSGRPNISLISAGGTVVSFVDFYTGTVHPAEDTADVLGAFPELADLANIHAKILFSTYSENMGAEQWQKLADCVAEEINNGADAVIIPHGTDTMEYTAAALSFMLGDVPKPVVLVGAMKPASCPSSDAITNLTAAIKFCTDSGKAGVFVVMHDTLGDDSFAVHLGTRVRKMHTSRRDAFESINASPAAHVDAAGKVELLQDLRDSSDGKAVARTAMEKDVVLLQYHPDMDPSLYRDVILKSKGVVISGTGLGNVGAQMLPLIREACDKGIVVVMASQCIRGAVNLNVYDNGKAAAAAGAVSAKDMLPEVAYVKLRWALANSKSREEAVEIMKTPVARETCERRLF